MNCWKAKVCDYNGGAYRIDTLKILNEKEYKLVTVRGRSKFIARDGSAINPFKPNQPATIHLNPDGYPCFGGGVPVHLYVAHAWVPGWFPGAEVDHIDYDRTNYDWSNLRWVTHTDNIKHSHVDSNHYLGNKAGSKNGRAMLTEAEVALAKSLFSRGVSTVDVIKTIMPHLDSKGRRHVWNRFNRIKTGQTWQSQ